MISKYYIQTNESYLASIEINIDNLLEQCINEIETNELLMVNPKIQVYGKECIQHRSIGFFSNESIGYKYSGKLARSINLTQNLSELLNLVNELFRENQSTTQENIFNGILVNKYSNGEDYIGKHSDNEKDLSNIGVVVCSYGASRKFRIRNKMNGNIIADIPTCSNEIWIMGGKFQQEFTHEIPIEKKVKKCRYSFTFRNHLI